MVMRMGLTPFQFPEASNVVGPLTPFLKPLMTLEAPLNAFFQPLVKPFDVAMEGPAEVLNDIAAGVKPEFVKLFEKFPDLFSNGAGAAGARAAAAARAAEENERIVQARLRAAGGGAPYSGRLQASDRRSVG